MRPLDIFPYLLCGCNAPNSVFYGGIAWGYRFHCNVRHTHFFVTKCCCAPPRGPRWSVGIQYAVTSEVNASMASAKMSLHFRIASGHLLSFAERRISARQALAHEYIVDPCDTVSSSVLAQPGSVQGACVCCDVHRCVCPFELHSYRGGGKFCEGTFLPWDISCVKFVRNFPHNFQAAVQNTFLLKFSKIAYRTVAFATR